MDPELQPARTQALQQTQTHTHTQTEATTYSKKAFITRCITYFARSAVMGDGDTARDIVDLMSKPAKKLFSDEARAILQKVTETGGDTEVRISVQGNTAVVIPGAALTSEQGARDGLRDQVLRANVVEALAYARCMCQKKCKLAEVAWNTLIQSTRQDNERRYVQTLKHMFDYCKNDTKNAATAEMLLDAAVGYACGELRMKTSARDDDDKRRHAALYTLYHTAQTKRVKLKRQPFQVEYKGIEVQQFNSGFKDAPCQILKC
jgi:hypothetical protein